MNGAQIKIATVVLTAPEIIPSAKFFRFIRIIDPSGHEDDKV